MNIQLTVVQLWALIAAGPIAMMLTVLVGILVNNATTGAKIAGLERGLSGEMNGLRAEMNGLRAEIAGVRSDLQRVEGVLSAKLDALAYRVKALEDEMHSPLVKR